MANNITIGWQILTTHQHMKYYLFMLDFYTCHYNIKQTRTGETVISDLPLERGSLDTIPSVLSMNLIFVFIRSQ
jgi:hypothetical protein